MNTKARQNLRAKSCKIVIGELDAREFLRLSSDCTLALFDIQRVHEVPSLSSLENAFLPMKLWLAKKLAVAQQSPVVPEQLSGVVVEMITAGGYFKVKVVHNLSVFRQPWTISFVDETCYTTIFKLDQRFPVKNFPRRINEEVVALIGRL